MRQRAIERGWLSFCDVLNHLAQLGSRAVPGRLRVRDFTKRCCQCSATGSHKPLYKLTVCDGEIKAHIAALLLGGCE
jgi:hypothetical protein